MSQDSGNLTVQLRTTHGKGVSRKLRAAGQIPGVVYGGGKENLLLSLSPLAMRKAMDPERKLNTFWKLDVLDDDGKKLGGIDCVIADYQLDVLRDTFTHVDFMRVSQDLPVSVNIPVEYTGKPVGVATGGKLRTLRRTVKIAAKPALIPIKLVVDVTDLDAGDSLRVRDVSIPDGEIIDRPDTVMALVEMPRGDMPDEDQDAAAAPAADADADAEAKSE